MKRFLLLLLFFCALFIQLYASGPLADRRIFELRIYHFATADQEAAIDNFLKNADLPALHRQKIKLVGVFNAFGKRHCY